MNGDQSMVQLKEQLEDIEYPMDTDTYILGDWSLQNYAKFIKLMDAVKPKLVIIDSLSVVAEVKVLMKTNLILLLLFIG